jgi:hypothetical protein
MLLSVTDNGVALSELLNPLTDFHELSYQCCYVSRVCIHAEPNIFMKSETVQLMYLSPHAALHTATIPTPGTRRVSSVGTVTGYRPGFDSQQDQDFHHLHSARTGSGALQASYPMGSGGKAVHSPKSSADVKDGGAISPPPLCPHCVVLTYRYNFTFCL